jgi:hypothetical protein
MITHVAIIFQGKTWSLPTPPNRHHHIIRWINRETGLPVDHDTQGFLDDHGCFLDRAAAMAHARACNQLRDPDHCRGEILFSEDLWLTPPVPGDDENPITD